MSKKKPTPGGRAKKKAEVTLVRSSAAEYLTFVAAGGDSEASVWSSLQLRKARKARSAASATCISTVLQSSSHPTRPQPTNRPDPTTLS